MMQNPLISYGISPKSQEMPQNLLEPFRTAQNSWKRFIISLKSSEHLHKVLKCLISCKNLTNYSEPMRTPRKSSEHFRRASQPEEAIHNPSEQMKTPQNTPKMPKNASDQSWNFKKSSKVWKWFRTSEFLRTLQNVWECLRAFINLSEPLRLHKNVFEHLRKNQNSNKTSEP